MSSQSETCAVTPRSVKPGSTEQANTLTEYFDLAAFTGITARAGAALEYDVAVMAANPDAAAASTIGDQRRTFGHFDVGVGDLLENGKLVTEGAGAAAAAAMLHGKLPELEGRRIVVVLSGANIDLNLLNRLCLMP